MKPKVDVRKLVNYVKNWRPEMKKVEHAGIYYFKASVRALCRATLKNAKITQKDRECVSLILGILGDGDATKHEGHCLPDIHSL